MLEDVTIRHAVPEDADDIIDFIREHWIIRNHVFTRRRDLFENCHLIEGRLTFIIAVGNDTGKIYGFISYAFNNHDFENPDISAPMFQALKTKNRTLGIDLLLALQEFTNCRSLFSPGIVKKTKGLYDYLGYSTGMLKHYYRLGNVAAFRICHIENLPTQAECTLEPFKMRPLRTMEEIDAVFPFEDYRHVHPYRDSWSVRRRYFENIGYEYIIWGILDGENSCKALIVGREIASSGAKMLKIVDYLGDDDALSHCSVAIGKILEERKLEYLDFYETGIDDEIMENAGFTLRRVGDENIIPNFFEPFERKNVDILCYTTHPGKFHIFRTDSGHDRPNFPEESGE